MTKSILFWWLGFVVVGIACAAIYDRLCANGWPKPGRGSNMRDDQQRAK
jgi:hypothetical protein